MASTSRLRHARVPAAVLFGALAAAACSSMYDSGHHSGSRLLSELPECPQHWGKIPLALDSALRDSLDRLAKKTGGSLPFRGIERERNGQYTFTDPNGEGIPASGPITNIPEFHDCQRFMTPDGRAFDSLFAVFAAFKLDTVVSYHNVTWSSSNSAVATVDPQGHIIGASAGTVTITATSTLDASITSTVALTVGATTTHTTVIMPPGGAVPPPVALAVGETLLAIADWPVQKQTYRAAATIYSYGPGYKPLGIAANFSCLFLYFGEGGQLESKMVPMSDLAGYARGCIEADPDTLHGTPLKVIRTVAGADAVPPVARWDWDGVNRQQYIGIACGNGWCEVGVDGPGGRFQPSPGYTAAAAAAAAPEAAVIRVKGWYDEQWLAFSDAAGKLVPGVRGVVIPDPALANIDSVRFSAGFTTVAYIALEQTPLNDPALSTYKKKFNLGAVPVTAPLTRMNRLSLCFGTHDACIPPDTPATSVSKCVDTFLGFSIKRWWSRIESADPASAAVYRCAIRRGHPDYSDKVPSTARWRWVLSDDTIWTQCIQGCCETEGGS